MSSLIEDFLNIAGIKHFNLDLDYRCHICGRRKIKRDMKVKIKDITNEYIIHPASNLDRIKYYVEYSIYCGEEQCFKNALSDNYPGHGRQTTVPFLDTTSEDAKRLQRLLASS